MFLLICANFRVAEKEALAASSPPPTNFDSFRRNVIYSKLPINTHVKNFQVSSIQKVHLYHSVQNNILTALSRSIKDKVFKTASISVHPRCHFLDYSVHNITQSMDPKTPFDIPIEFLLLPS